jgi:hypothetical protein
MVRTTTKLDAAHEPNSDGWNAHDTLAFTPISDAERAFRKALMERMLARRNEQEFLDIPSDQLVRESRAEAYGVDER